MRTFARRGGAGGKTQANRPFVFDGWSYEMGIWGMGIAQSDEFCEVYESFLERYDEGEEVEAITKSILEEYFQSFSRDDPVMHDVYFALAKAEWICAAQSPQIMSRVEEIIASKANIDFYNELGASAADLRSRQKNLEKFLEKLQTARASAKKRIPAPKNTSAKAEKGKIFWYRSKGKIYGALVLDIVNQNRILVALSEPLISAPKTVDEVLNAAVYTVAWGAFLLPPKRTHELGIIPVQGSYNGRAGLFVNDHLSFCENFMVDAVWAHERCGLHFCEKTIADLLDVENLPNSFRNQERLGWAIQRKMCVEAIIGWDNVE